MISLDGYFEGPNKELDWHKIDAEFNTYVADFLDSADLLLFGRLTYKVMESYWPTEQAKINDPLIAKKMNSISKVVFSRTLHDAPWHNTILIKENAVEEVQRLKQQPGKQIIVIGSSTLAVELIKSNLIDEFHIIVSPIVLGSGSKLFAAIKDRLCLQLTSTTEFQSGNILSCYKPTTGVQ